MQKLNNIAICRGRRPRRPIAVLYIFLPRAWRQDEHLLLRHYLSFLRQYADIRHVLLKEKSEAHLHNNKKYRQILNVSWFVQKLNKIAICRGRRPRRPIAVLYIFLPRAWRQDEH